MARASDSPAAPRISQPDLPPHLEPAQPSRGADFLQAALDLGGDVNLAHATLEQCTVTADADSIDLTGATILDVDAKDLRVASMTLRNAGIRRLRITGGRIGTLDLSGTRIDELEIRDVRIDYLTLGGAKGSDILFADSTIRTLDMPQAQLTRMRFDRCHTQEVDPRGLRAKDVDLRGLDADTFVDANSLRGTTLTTHQIQQLAPVIAAGLGIQIKD
ncbi:pentapeptide repeat-containing protein [Microbacterium sp. A93]|uniref:pentapeptide repeat-containing protein n=1 Tax=Microbacterium sp. A93 TaxID=3450716 RepID=UPI003F43305F